jgi:hypothetical protein
VLKGIGKPMKLQVMARHVFFADANEFVLLMPISP